MKTAINTVLGLTTSVALANPDYVNTVRQIQQDTGVEWDVTVAPVGSLLSPEGVGVLGSNFELWTLHTVTGQASFLDSEFVSAYTPEAEIEIITGDPYTHVPRTRVDKPFTVNVSVDGLLSGGDVPEAAKAIDYEHVTLAYPEGEHGFGDVEPEGTVFNRDDLEGNGITPFNFAMSNIVGPDLSEVEGEEIFSVYSKADGQMPSELLDRQKVVVWPVAKAEIEGLEDGKAYSSLPVISIKLVDLYPDSTTYVRIYPGDVSNSPEDAIEINDADLVIYDVEPQDRTLTLSNLEGHVSESGVWTIEVLHKTPWGVERLTHESPVVSDSMKVRGTLYSR